jgi:hypothetical protein
VSDFRGTKSRAGRLKCFAPKRNGKIVNLILDMGESRR